MLSQCEALPRRAEIEADIVAWLESRLALEAPPAPEASRRARQPRTTSATCRSYNRGASDVEADDPHLINDSSA